MKTTDQKYVSLGLRAVGEFGAIIAVPVVVFALGGKWLDGRLGTKPAFVIVGFALAAVVSGVSTIRKSRDYGKQYMNIEAEEKAMKQGNTK